mgnify:CR=1 FL=1
MGNSVKNSYLIQRILGKIIGSSDKKDDLSKLNISREGKAKAGKYYQGTKGKITPKQKKQASKSQVNEFVQYQKEIEAIKLLKSSDKLKSPGKILKLPISKK